MVWDEIRAEEVEAEEREIAENGLRTVVASVMDKAKATLGREATSRIVASEARQWAERDFNSEERDG